MQYRNPDVFTNDYLFRPNSSKASVVMTGCILTGQAMVGGVKTGVPPLKTSYSTMASHAKNLVKFGLKSFQQAFHICSVQLHLSATYEIA